MEEAEEDRITTHPKLIIKLRDELEQMVKRFRERSSNMREILVKKINPVPFSKFPTIQGLPLIVSSDGSSYPIGSKGNRCFLISAVAKEYLRKRRIFRVHSIPFESSLSNEQRSRLNDIIRETLRLEVILEWVEEYGLPEFIMVHGPLIPRPAAFPRFGDPIEYHSWFNRYVEALRKLYKIADPGYPLIGVVEKPESKFLIRKFGLKTELTDVALLDEVMPVRTCYPTLLEKPLFSKKRKGRTELTELTLRGLPFPCFTYMKTTDLREPIRIDLYPDRREIQERAISLIISKLDPVSGIPFPIGEVHYECVISRKLIRDLRRELEIWT